MGADCGSDEGSVDQCDGGSPSDPTVVYVGTGNVSMVGAAVNDGNDVWKSLDAGHTWQHVDLEETEHIGTIWIDPTDPDVVVVAALAKTFSKSGERGIFKTIDGGKTWKKTLAGTDAIGAIDVVFDATNAKIGMWRSGTITAHPVIRLTSSTV